MTVLMSLRYSATCYSTEVIVGHLSCSSYSDPKSVQIYGGHPTNSTLGIKNKYLTQFTLCNNVSTADYCGPNERRRNARAVVLND